MGLVAEFEVRCERLPLVAVAAAVPEATLLVRMQPNGGERRRFIVRVPEGPIPAVERAFEDAAFVGEYRLVGRAGETRRYKVRPGVGMDEQLGDDVDVDGLRALASADAVIERIRVTPSGWIQSGWFADRAAFDEFRSFWRENGGFSLRRLTRDGETDGPDDGLTDPQREALHRAREMGYFEIPRTASLAEVAEELGISASSLSERLRRAQAHLIESAVESPRRREPSPRDGI